MPEESAPANETPVDAAQASGARGVRGLLPRMIRWGLSSRLRMAVTGALLVVLLGAFFATWSYVAHLVVRREFPVSLAMALYALDVEEYDKAKDIIGRVQRRTGIPKDFGGALFVLGAVKAHQADCEWSLDRQRAMYLMAARYIRKALALGVPPERENEAKYLLGLSLIHGNQPDAGIVQLEAIVDDPIVRGSEIHALLSDAYQALPTPDYESALEHNRILLSADSLTDAERANAVITSAELLGELGRLPEASEQLQTVEDFAPGQARIKHVSGKLALRTAERSSEKTPERLALINQALDDFKEAKRLDPRSGEMDRQAMYWTGRCHEAKGETEDAIATYDRLSKQHSDTDESLAAMLAKADLEHASGLAAKALAGYRSVLESVGDPVTYVNKILPLIDLRKKLLRAHTLFLEAKQFEHSMALVRQLQPVFSLVEVAELSGTTEEKWGTFKLRQAADADRRDESDLVKEGYYHLRAAGRAFESLAELRFETRQFTHDLWRSANNYFLGHSFTHAARVLDEFLHHEAELYQAVALLRLGQSQLANNQIEKAAATLEECMDLHPRDSVVYQARLERFQAYMHAGKHEEAKQLLLTNIVGDDLKTTSPEWRDSLFALGEFYQNTGEYGKAIKTLDEAVRRFAEAPQTLMARYSIARAYHDASKQPSKIAREAKTESERQKNRKLRDQNLEEALQNYIAVQRDITTHGDGEHTELERTLLRNCYMMQGSVLFQLRRYHDARKAYSNISTLYVNEPFVLESFVHIANCLRRLNQPSKAKLTIEQAKLVLQRFPEDTDFKLATNFNREQWKLLLSEMSNW